jgi:hypothetical protein
MQFVQAGCVLVKDLFGMQARWQKIEASRMTPSEAR